jgi:hypothetical protein
MRESSDLLATVAFGLGINKILLEELFTSLPFQRHKNIYLQEIGRAGRDMPSRKSHRSGVLGEEVLVRHSLCTFRPSMSKIRNLLSLLPPALRITRLVAQGAS